MMGSTALDHNQKIFEDSKNSGFQIESDSDFYSTGKYKSLHANEKSDKRRRNI